MSGNDQEPSTSRGGPGANDQETSASRIGPGANNQEPQTSHGPARSRPCALSVPLAAWRGEQEAAAERGRLLIAAEHAAEKATLLDEVKRLSSEVEALRAASAEDHAAATARDEREKQLADRDTAESELARAQLSLDKQVARLDVVERAGR